jgi:hypothetical protein
MAFAQAPSINPHNLHVAIPPSTSINENVAKISWARGNGSHYIVLVNVFDYKNPTSMITPNDQDQYYTTGNYRIERISTVEDNSVNPVNPTERTSTYILYTGAYTSAPDTASLLNAKLAGVYDIQVFEFNPHSTGVNQYSASQSARFTPRYFSPFITKTELLNSSTMGVEWSIAFEVQATNYTVMWSADSTDFTNTGNARYVYATTIKPLTAPKYQTVVPYTYSPKPLYYKVFLLNGNPTDGYFITASSAVATLPKPLAVTLVSFDAKRVKDAVNLTWVTSSELDNAGFEVQRSLDSKKWSKISFVAGQGNSTTVKTYKATDIYGITAYYRLAQQDLSGLITYSPVFYVPAEKSVNLSAFPNPSQGQSIQIVGAEPAQPIQLLNTSGQVIREFVGPTLTTENIKPGLYLLKQESKTTRIVIR